MDELEAARRTEEFGLYGIKDPRDRYADRLYDPDNEQGPCYEGLYITPITDRHDHKVRHVIVRMRQVHEGGMREFYDPKTGETVGCCGQNFAHEYVLSVEDWLHEMAGIRLAEIQRGRRRWVLPWRGSR